MCYSTTNQMCLLNNKTKSNNYTCSKEHIIKDTVIIIIISYQSHEKIER